MLHVLVFQFLPVVSYVDQLTGYVVRVLRCQEQRELDLSLGGNAARYPDLLSFFDSLAPARSPACRISSVILVYAPPGSRQLI